MACRCESIAKLTRDPVVIAGQSNGETEQLGTWGINDFANVALGGSTMTQWAQGQTLNDNLVSAIEGFPPGVVYVYWIHGEGDSILQANADAYETRLGDMIDDLRAEPSLSAYTIKFIIVELHADLISSRAYQSTVRAAGLAIAAAKTDCWTVSFNAYALGPDEIHHHLGTAVYRQQDLDAERMSH